MPDTVNPVGGDSVQTDPISSFSFDNVHEQAMARWSDTPPAAEGGEEHVETPAPVEASSTEGAVDANATPAEGGEGDAQNVDDASAAQLAQLKDTDLVEVTVAGELVQLPWKEAKGGVMRQAHYTKSMQALRAEQAQFQQEREANQTALEERETLTQLLRNPDLLQQFIARQYPQLVQGAQQLQQVAEQVDPNDIATVGQIQAAQEQLIRQQQELQEQFMAQLAEREETLTRTIEDRQVVAKLSSEINTTIKGLFGENPTVVKLIPNAEQLLRYEVSQLKPSTPEETVEAFKTVFGGWVENYKSAVAEENKSKVIAKQKLVNNNIQPPGGTAPQPAPTSFKKVNKMTGKTEVDWDALRATALNYGK